MPTPKLPIPTESQEQTALFSWAGLQSNVYPELALLFHIPNGGSRSKAEGGRFKAEGVKAGIPDICLPVGRGTYHGLFIELKRIDGGKLSKNQELWISRLNAYGYFACICRGWEEAKDTIIWYLKQEGK
ncbi:hypothetical protein FACS1894217_04630 [Clostridia bacterium]|nr:hypothetical protein FACS1894217_04630 [Clostridia bacterium]